MTAPNTPQEITDLIATAQATEDVEDSAILVLTRIPTIVQNAIDAFVAAHPGVDLSPITAVVTGLKAKSDALAAAIIAVPS